MDFDFYYGVWAQNHMRGAGLLGSHTYCLSAATQGLQQFMAAPRGLLWFLLSPPSFVSLGLD